MQHLNRHSIAALLLGAAIPFHAACEPTTPAPAPATPPVAETVTPAADATTLAPAALYGTCEPGEGGSGKTYMGREIAEVMGHFGVGWLERPEREREERTDLLVGALKLRPADAVADIGAGSGYFTMRMSPLVPEGVVYATDIQQEMLDIVKERALEEGALNVMPVMGRIDHCGLEPSSVDIVLFVDAYHEFSHPREMMESIVTALKPGGRVYLVEYRLEDPSVLIKERHKMSEKQARLEMEAVGLAFVLNIGVLPQQHILVFRRD
ncbi:MAG: class I SAM-dependent methyltransferase [Phycisphaerales bacterium]|jgi:SAM-dependent methyltransferase